MARVQLAVIAQYWSASGPMELFVVVVKNSITMVGWCCSFVCVIDVQFLIMNMICSIPYLLTIIHLLR